jgi:hypothetical protein
MCRDRFNEARLLSFQATSLRVWREPTHAMAVLHFEDSPVVTCFVLHKRMAELEQGMTAGATSHRVRLSDVVRVRLYRMSRIETVRVYGNRGTYKPPHLRASVSVPMTCPRSEPGIRNDLAWPRETRDTGARDIRQDTRHLI